MENIKIRSIQNEDKEWMVELLNKEWGSSDIITRGKKHDALNIPGFIATMNDKPVGLITYVIDNNACEIVSLNSLVEGKGIGSKLIDAVKQTAKENNCKRVWLIETNDNTRTLRFYQKRGFHLVAIYQDALAEYRKMKPEIPLVGQDGIPLRDELGLEILLYP